MSSLIKVEWEPRGVARVTIDRPAKRNAMSSELMRMLIAAMQAISARDDLRVVVLTGAGGQTFVGGADVKEMAQLDADAARAFITLVHQTCRAMIDCPVPVIARIDGYALGAGLELAAACDLRIASHGARFAMPEVKLGMPSVVEAVLLSRLLGSGRARWLVYTGDAIDAATALDWGLVSQVVPEGELDDTVERVVASMLANGPLAMRVQKQLCVAWDERPMQEVIDRSIDAFARVMGTQEARTRLSGFGRSAVAGERKPDAS